MNVLFGIASAATVVTVLAGCSAGHGDELSDAIAASADRTVSIADAFDTDATAFFVVCPYASPNTVNDRLGFSWDSQPDYSLSDDLETVAFIDHGTVIDSVEISRDVVDLCSAGTEWSVTDANAELGYVSSSTGWELAGASRTH